MTDFRYEVHNAQTSFGKKVQEIKDYIVNNPTDSAIILLAGTAVMHEIGYFIRSIKMH